MSFTASRALRPLAGALLLLSASTLAAQLPMRTLGPISGRGIGYIDSKGRDIVEEIRAGGETPYVVGRTFHDGFAGVRRIDGSWTWIDTQGHAITAARYHSISDFVGEYAFAHPIDDTTRVVAVDRRGNERSIGVANGTFLRRSVYAIYREPDAQRRMRRGYISGSGQKITAPEFTATGAFLNGRGLAERISDSSIVLFDANGRVVADSGLYAKAFVPFADNRLPVSATHGGLVGYIDSLGTWVVPPTFTEATGFGEERAAVKRPGQSGWNVIGPDGRNAFAGEFKAAPDFYRGYARVTRVNDDTTMLIDRNGKSPKVSTRLSRTVGSDGMLYSGESGGIRYITLDGKEVITAETIRGRRIATIGEPFFEGFSLVSYRPRVVATTSADDDPDEDDASVAGSGASGSAVTFVWYELRQTMGAIMGGGNSKKRFTVYWGTVEAPSGSQIGTLTQRFPARPQETTAPRRRIDAVALRAGETLDIEAILIRRNRADFSIVRRNGKDRIDDNVRYTLLNASAK
jgi:hypothetical protein